MKFIKKLLFSDDHRVIRNIISTALYAIALLTFDLSFRIIYRQYNTSAIGEHVPLLFSIFWVTIFCAVSFLLPRLARRIYLILTSFVFALFALVHAFLQAFSVHI